MENEFHPAEDSAFSERDYRRGQIGLIASGAINNMGANFVSVTYLSAMMLLLGISASKIALVVSTGSFAGLAMGLAPYLYPSIKRPKLFLIFAILIQTVPLSLVLTFPFFGFDTNAYISVFAAYLIFNLMGNLGTPMYSEIQELYAEHNGKTGRYYSWCAAANNGFAFLALLLITVLSGSLEKSDPELLYFLLGILALFSFVGRVIIIAFTIREPKLPPIQSPGNLLHGLVDMFTSRRFRPYMVYGLCVSIGGAMISGIQTVFFVQRMGLSLQLLALLDTIALLGRMAVSPLLGKLNNRYDTRKLFAWSILLCSFCYLLHVIMTPENAVVLRILQQIVGIVSFAGTGIFASPFMFQCMPEEKHISYMSFIQVAASVVCFLVGLLVSGIVDWTEGMSITVLNVSFTEMHFLHLGCAVMYLIPAIYLFSLEKKEKK